MNNATTVENDISYWKQLGTSKAEMVLAIATDCLGWAYVFGARGQYCTPSVRRSYADRSSCPEAEAKVIKAKCQVCNGKKSACDGCKWYPNGKTRVFDCRGFTYWVFKQIDIIINGAGATSQWNNADNWESKGLIKDLPSNVVCCVFMQNGKKMSHTGIHVGNGVIIHCSGEVKRGKTSDKGWTHYAVPKGMEGDVPVPTPTPVPVSKPTLRIGSTGEYVVECQNDLLQLGYDLSPYGADGKYGKKTASEVAKFQTVHGLKADGICGKLTWAALDEAVKPQPEPSVKTYTVHIPHQTEEQAGALIEKYPDAWKTDE